VLGDGMCWPPGFLVVGRTMYRGGRSDPKTARSRRRVAVPGFAVAYPADHRREQAERRLASVAWNDDGYVFDAGAGVLLSVESVSRRFGQLAERAGRPISGSTTCATATQRGCSNVGSIPKSCPRR
jgi:hypothetical protein